MLGVGVGDAGQPLKLQRILAEMKAADVAHDKRCVGTLFPRPSNFVQPKGNVAHAILEAAREHNVKAVDLSAPLLPRMTIAQAYAFKARLFRRIEEDPKTIFFITVDQISATEAILLFDHDLKFAASSSNMQYRGNAQGLVWRGEDYLRLCGIDENMNAVKQGLRPLLSPDEECVVCMEVLTEIVSAISASSKFACGHVLCARCAASVKECPTCRTKSAPRGV